MRLRYIQKMELHLIHAHVSDPSKTFTLYVVFIASAHYFALIYFEHIEGEVNQDGYYE